MSVDTGVRGAIDVGFETGSCPTSANVVHRWQHIRYDGRTAAREAGGGGRSAARQFEVAARRRSRTRPVWKTERKPVITHSVVQRVWFIDAMLKGNGRAWPDLEELVAAIYAAHLRPGDVALDVGFNRGLHLLRMADLVGSAGEIVGIEAVPAFMRDVRGRLGEAGGELAGRVVLHECAVGAMPGRADFFVTSITDGGLSGLKLRPVIASEAFETIAVEVRTLDSLLPKRPVRFAKIDIEGGEYDALLGSPHLLAQQPLIAFEFNDSAPAEFGYHVNELRDLLARAGYRIHDIFGFEIDSGIAMMAARVWNFLAIPPNLNPYAVTAPARAILETRNPELVALAPAPPPGPELVERL